MATLCGNRSNSRRVDPLSLVLASLLWDVKVPVVIWQGGLDRNVPVVHGEWLRDHIAGSRYELRPDESHVGIFVNYEEEIIESAAQLLG